MCVCVSSPSSVCLRQTCRHVVSPPFSRHRAFSCVFFFPPEINLFLEQKAELLRDSLRSREDSIGFRGLCSFRMLPLSLWSMSLHSDEPAEAHKAASDLLCAPWVAHPTRLFNISFNGSTSYRFDSGEYLYPQTLKWPWTWWKSEDKRMRVGKESTRENIWGPLERLWVQLS